MDNNFQGQSWQDNPLFNNVLDTIAVLSFFIGLQNLELNITANDLERTSNSIVDVLNNHLLEQDTHLKRQDIHLKRQDEHMTMQDERLDNIEAMIYELLHGRKEN